MFTRCLVLFLLFIVICLSPAWNAAAQNSAPRIESVRYGQHPGYFRIVLDLSRPMVCTPDSGNASEIVLTCPPFRWNAGSNKPPTSSLLTRFGPRNGKNGTAQITGDSLNEIGIAKVFSVPARDGAPPRLVIDYRRGASPATPEMQDTPAPPTDFDNMVAGLAQDRPQTDQVPATGDSVLPARKPAPGSWPVGEGAEGDSVVAKPIRKQPFVIVLDPGHGGVDPGARSVNGGNEKDIVLAIAREVKKELESDPNYTVRMTRDSDVFIKLGDRVKIGRKYKANLFVSLHADSLPTKRGARGASFYTISQTASDAQTAKLADRENKADMLGGINIEHEDKMVENILLDLITRDTVNHSKFFANTLMETYRRKNMDMLNPAHRSAGFAVLKAADIPSVLIELGFLSNPDEADRLTDLDYRRRIAATIKASIDSYVNGSSGGF